ncbi:MAG: DUF1795 domain-containing protein, partial [Actinomycetota bacterium]|nr:DUF1795 domain-containing protein [Actinomycetota bacterium]
GRALVPAVAFALVAVLVGLLAWGVADDGDDGDAPEQATETTAAAPSTTAGARPRAAPSTTRVTQVAGVPANWVSYTDPATGYRIAHPPTWRVRPLDRTRTDITDPDTGSYLRVDWTDKPGPSPEADWERQSPSFGSRHAGYQELRIDPTTYKGFPAAEWEYAYSSGGARLHAIDLGFVTGRYGFALNFQTPEAIWQESQPTFEAFKAAFQPPA